MVREKSISRKKVTFWVKIIQNDDKACFFLGGILKNIHTPKEGNKYKHKEYLYL